MFRLSSGSTEHRKCSNAFFNAVKDSLSDSKEVARILVDCITDELSTQLPSTLQYGSVVEQLKSDINTIIGQEVHIEYEEFISPQFDIEVSYTMEVSTVISRLNKAEFIKYTAPLSPVHLVGSDSRAHENVLDEA